jgi:hypothetical protein
LEAEKEKEEDENEEDSVVESEGVADASVLNIHFC